MAKANPLEGAKEIQHMLLGYAKQETVEPLKSLGTFLIWGVSGAIMVFLGVAFLAMGVLRVSQSYFNSSHIASAVPYLLAILTLVAAIAVIYALFSRSKKRVLR